MSYLLLDVIEKEWGVFMEELQKVQSLDDIIKIHTNFVDCVLEKSLLGPSNDRIFGELNKLLELVDRFKYSQQSINFQINDHISKKEEIEQKIRENGSEIDDTLMDEENNLDNQGWQEKQLESYVKANKTIDDIWNSFKLTLHGFLDMIEASMHLKELSIMLDFNEYYKQNNIRPRTRINFDDLTKNRDKQSESQSLIIDNPKINLQDNQFNKLAHKSPMRNNSEIGNHKKPGSGNVPNLSENLINQNQIKSTRSMVNPKGSNRAPHDNSARMEEESDTVQSRPPSSSKNTLANNAYLRDIVARNKLNKPPNSNQNDHN